HTRFDCDWSSDVCSSDLAVNSDTPALDIEEARNHVRDGGFPSPAWSHKCNDLAALSLEGDSMKHLRLAIVAEVNLLEAHMALHRSEERRVGKEGGAQRGR